MVDVAAILDKQTDEIKRPKPAPTGVYEAIIQSYRFDESSKKKTPFVEFEIKLLSVRGEVDDDLLETAGGMSEVGKKGYSATYYLTDNAAFMLKDYLIDVLGMNGSGRTIGEMLPETVNAKMLVTIIHKTSEDGKNTYANIGSSAIID